MTAADILLIVVGGLIVVGYLRIILVAAIVLAALRSIISLELIAAMVALCGAVFVAARFGWRPALPRRQARPSSPADMTNVIPWPVPPR